MGPQVSFQVGFVCEAFLTKLTYELTRLCMELCNVMLEVLFFLEGPRAVVISAVVSDLAL